MDVTQNLIFFTSYFIESAKSRAWRACVLTCLACLRAYVLGVLTFLTCLRACMLTCLACLRAWHAYELACSCVWRAYVLGVLKANKTNKHARTSTPST